MNRYANLGVLIFRTIGVVMFAIGLMGVLYYALSVWVSSSTGDTEGSARAIASPFYMGAGLIMFLVGKPLGKLVGKGLSD
jgi:hypothetical protein